MNDIEKDVPPPSRPASHPYKDMEPGQSVLVDTQAKADYARVYGHKTGKQFSVRKQAPASWRVWRIS